MKGKYRRYKAWCWGCDRYQVAGGMKCPICGVRMVATKVRGKEVVLKELRQEEDIDDSY